MSQSKQVKSKNKMYKLIGYATDFDKFNKLHLLFLDDYNKDDYEYEKKDSLNTKAILKMLNEKYCESVKDYSPVKDKYFMVKADDKSFVLREDIKGKTIKDVVQHKVIVEVIPKKFKYEDNSGWYLKLYSVEII
jgi:hypothetical protein